MLWLCRLWRLWVFGTVGKALVVKFLLPEIECLKGMPSIVGLKPCKWGTGKRSLSLDAKTKRHARRESKSRGFSPGSCYEAVQSVTGTGGFCHGVGPRSCYRFPLRTACLFPLPQLLHTNVMQIGDHPKPASIDHPKCDIFDESCGTRRGHRAFDTHPRHLL